MQMLRARLYEAELEKQQAEQGAERLSQIGHGNRSEKIRTYNQPQDRVCHHATIHRIGFNSTYNGVLRRSAGHCDRCPCRCRPRREARAGGVRQGMANEAWTVKRILEWTRGYLERKGRRASALSAEWLISDVTGLSRVQIYMNFDKPLTPSGMMPCTTPWCVVVAASRCST